MLVRWMPQSPRGRLRQHLPCRLQFPWHDLHLFGLALPLTFHFHQLDVQSLEITLQPLWSSQLGVAQFLVAGFGNAGAHFVANPPLSGAPQSFGPSCLLSPFDLASFWQPSNLWQGLV
ncbi:hypothetical protein VNO80_19237 [Phaseolus coccineus]|uniref:Uncharacterized protein n=1 Tax=Phaseolus coccineus TaxID=3886 RepID=A0AAN9MFM6_PHACN